MSQARSKAWKYYQEAKDYADDHLIVKIAAWVIFIGLVVGLVTVSIINLKPYTVLMSGAMTQANWVYQLPILGNWLQRTEIGLSMIGAILIWAPVQAFQVMWLLIWLDTRAQKTAIKRSLALQGEFQANNQHRSLETRQAVRRIVRIPFFFIKWAVLLALAAYSFDLTIGLHVYPLWDSWTKFNLWAKSFNPVWLNTTNARDLGIMLFSFEALLILVIITWQWIDHRRAD